MSSSTESSQGSEALVTPVKTPLPGSILNVSINSDLTLVFQGDVRLQVSSHALCNASKVFAAMLGPGGYFREAERSGNAEREVELPDDDVGAFLILCKLLHHDTETVGRDLDPEELLKLAKVADKYDCIPAIYLKIKTSLEACEVPCMRYDMSETLLESNSCYDMLAASFLINDSDQFRKWSRATAITHGRSFLTFENHWESSILPTNILVALQESRTIIHSRLVCALTTSFDHMQRSIWCKFPEFILGLSTGSQAVVDSMIPLSQTKKGKMFMDIVGPIFESALKQSRGLCLDCVKAEIHNAAQCDGLKHKLSNFTAEKRKRV